MLDIRLHALTEQNDADSAFPLYIGRICPVFFRVRHGCMYKQSLCMGYIIALPVRVLATFVPPIEAVSVVPVVGLRCGIRPLVLVCRALSSQTLRAISWCK